MIIGIILNNFFKKYYMNKKFIHILNNKLPVIFITILGLIYVYLNIPDDYTIQLGGAIPEGSMSLPKNTPFLYRYRWLFVAIPFLIIGVIINSLVYSQRVEISLWDSANAFLYNFAKQNKIANEKKMKITLQTVPGDLTDDPELLKYINMIKLTIFDKSGLYPYAQFFCSAYRPCSCCLEPEFKKWIDKSGSKMCEKALTPSSLAKSPNFTPTLSTPR